MRARFATVAVLVATWTVLGITEAGAAPWTWSDRIDRMIVVALGAVTAASIVVTFLSGPALYAALRLGRDIERAERRGQDLVHR